MKKGTFPSIYGMLYGALDVPRVSLSLIFRVMHRSGDLYIDGWSPLVVSNLERSTEVTFESYYLCPGQGPLGLFLQGFSMGFRTFGHMDTLP